MTRASLLAAIAGLALAAPWQRAACAAKPAAPQGPIPGFPKGPTMDRVVPGELLVDPPTLENLGFRWYVAGDSNRNASVRVAYREAGTDRWRDALPMLRVHHEVANQDYGPYRTGNLFAGSAMFLKPGTAYEVRLSMDDPDGGAPPPKLLTVATRKEPAAQVVGRRRHVWPADSKDRVPEGALDGLQAALEGARPGDVLLLHAGVYRGPFAAAPKGTPEKPIVLRPAGDGEAVLEGTGHGADLLDLNGAEHLRLEGLTLRHARTAILGGDPVPDSKARMPNVRAISTGTITPYSTLDYNGYRRNGPGQFILWYDGTRQSSYDTLAQFAAGAGHEAHGVMVDYDVFVRAVPPKRGVTCRPEQYDLRLRPGAAAVDRGCVLPNVNDGYRGKAPDLGCYELSGAPPQFGPRRSESH